PPVITEQPKGGVVRRNDPYTLNCAAQDAKTISWYHNGEPITDLLKDPSSPRILLPSGSLFFLRVATTKKVNDAGTYWCVAQNSAGSVRSDNATIEVAAIDDEFLEIPRPTINVIAGEALTLPCRPPKGTPEPQINWLKNGQVIESDGRVYTSASGELRFLVTKAEDSATYACQASNAAGTKISAPTEITVMDPPSFVIAPKNRTVTTGTILSLPCQVSGFPTPKVDWLRLDGKIPLGRASVSSENSLQLTQVTASDSGIYACVAENEAGMIRAEVHVDVLALPFFKERPNDHVIEVGSTRLLPCIMDGDPPPILMWRLPGEDPTDILLPGHKKGHNRVEEDGRLVMENVKLSESGLYTCMGTNSGGGVSARAKILVVEAFPPPVVGVGPQDQTISNGDHMTLPCEPVSESSEASVSWWFRPAAHLPQHEIVDDPSRGISLSANHALTIRNTNRSNSGIYTCRVTAATGNAEATAVVRFEENELLGHRLEKLLPAPPSKPRKCNRRRSVVSESMVKSNKAGASKQQRYDDKESLANRQKGLDPYTYYTFFLVPFWRNIEGAPTNSLSLTTPEDKHHKTWSAIDTPRMQPNACLLRHNHYVNDYAEPNNLVPSDGSQVEAYTTTALMAPTSPHHELPGPGQWTAFLPPPPPSCPPPPLCQYSGSEGTTCSSSHSSSDSYHRGFQNRQPVGVELCSEASCPVYSSGSCGGYKRPCDEASEHTYEAYNQRPSHGAYTETHNLVGCPDSHRTVMHYSPTSSNASSQRGRHVPDNHPPYKPDVPESIPLRKSPVDDSFPTFSSLHAAPKSLHRSDQRL
ncbi:hypothetical protein HAZT_HAZT001863, partial [Hyalella azteca]